MSPQEKPNQLKRCNIVLLTFLALILTQTADFVQSASCGANKMQTTILRMMRGLIAAAVVVTFSACGSDNIRYHNNATKEQTRGYEAYAKWGSNGCDIFIQSVAAFPIPPDLHYQATLEHEEKHCFDGEWHDTSKEWYSKQPQVDPFCNSCHKGE